MAARTVNRTPTPSARVIGNAFVEQYYNILHHSPELAFRFYQEASLLSRPDANGVMTTVTTMKSINEKICSLDYKNYKAEIKTADAQDSYEDGVILLVTGFLTGKDNRRREFAQTFFLAPQENGFYVLNDVFRFSEENGPDLGVLDTTSSSLEPNPEPAQVADSTVANHAYSEIHEVEAVEGEIDDQVVDEGKTVDDSDVAEDDPHLNKECNGSITEESLPSPIQEEDAPRKSYASIVVSPMKYSPTKDYVPKNTAKVVPEEIEKQQVNDAESMNLESSSPIARDIAPESKGTQNEVESHSIYICNLPPTITVSELEAEFQKFGAIKANGIQVRNNRHQDSCFGFIEFQEFSSVESAIKASPILIEDRLAAVEIKRSTSRVGSGRIRYRNNGPRNRGNYFRIRGNISSGRNGEGSGGRRSSPTRSSASTCDNGGKF